MGGDQMKRLFLSLFLAGCVSVPKAPDVPEPGAPTVSIVSSLYKDAQGSRGAPRASFVDELFQIFLKMPDSAFEANSVTDIYSVIEPKLGPWRGITHRRSAAFESMISLAGRESSWNWNEGRDKSASNTSAETEESGAWQTSCNARVFDARAKALLNGISCSQYIPKAKSDHEFATLFTWYVIRGTIRHHGPVLRGEILPPMQKARVDALEAIFKKAGK